MDHIKIGNLTQKDFDEIIADAGGCRFSPDDSREAELNADYVLDNAVIELKLIEEEGLAKVTRQQNLAALFRKRYPDRPVIVLNPASLDAEAERRYYNLMAGPMKTAVKKAAEQLEVTRMRLGGDHARVLMLINVGFTALTHEEFKRIAIKCVANDTKKIDHLVVGGAYYYSDAFDMNVHWPLEHVPLRIDRPFPAFDKLFGAWNRFGARFMTRFIQSPEPLADGRLPVVDLAFDYEGVRYVKPAPVLGMPSQFWRNGRPRANSTGITSCPSVAKTFPGLSASEWKRFREAMPNESFFRENYREWNDFQNAQDKELTKLDRPFVPMPVLFDAFTQWCQAHSVPANRLSLCDFANELFDQAVKRTISRAVERNTTGVTPSVYVLLATEEIGQDQANDLCTICIVRELLSGERAFQKVAENLRLFFEHGLALASAYAIKHGVDVVLFERDRTNAWV